MHDLEITVHDTPDAVDALIVDQGLDAANQAAAPLHDVRPLACFARDRAGAVVAGAVGRRWGECAELQQLWVRADLRRRGWGARLVRAFERRAAELGCKRVYLETFSFQAPTLYRSLGYEVRHTIGGYAPGIHKQWMVHELDR
ncbi:MAG TPA: GNAT family N-acetyltransferase [Burkholderiaceae bacterium]|nr:GNAT family N-acetyltransferase [Burkholderiaceae bacterium]